jgi:hypothetical protein
MYCKDTGINYSPLKINHYFRYISVSPIATPITVIMAPIPNSNANGMHIKYREALNALLAPTPLISNFYIIKNSFFNVI